MLVFILFYLISAVIFAVVAISYVLIMYKCNQKVIVSSNFGPKQVIKKVGQAPGPQPWPVIGNLDIFRRFRNNPFEGFTALTKKYGDIYSLTLGQTLCLVVNNLDLIREVLNENGKFFGGRPNFIRYHKLFGDDRNNFGMCFLKIGFFAGGCAPLPPFDEITKTHYIIFGLIFIFTLVSYWIFFVPFNWKKHLNDVSYHQALETEDIVNRKNKRDAINRLRKTRKIDCKELPPPYPNGWYGILESSKIRVNEAKYLSCLGEHFVIFRTQSEEVFVLDAYCPHLGANLGVGGRVSGENIVCPFHQWSFSGRDGICVNIPYSVCEAPITKVKKWISKEINSYIFIWYHAEITNLQWEIPSCEEIENKLYSYHGSNEFYVNCHIQEIPENGADLAHFAAIHNPSIFAGSFNPKEKYISELSEHHWEAKWNAMKGQEKHVAIVKLTHSFKIAKKYNFFRMQVVGRQIGPSYVLLSLHFPVLGTVLISQTILPIEPLLQKVVHRFYAPRWIAPIMKFVIVGESIMFERDMTMWNHKTYLNKPVLVKEDLPLKQFRSWYKQFYTPNSKAFTESLNSGW